ncbi:Cyclin- protein fam58a [Cichlidogyrus casuarinus]|uniref:Cyclin- protein fam58a n=1 Tax=Cichlidogyrus casuarinus TaxID=1844966 RepID=A0ABD2QRX3_9PLAT
MPSEDLDQLYHLVQLFIKGLTRPQCQYTHLLPLPHLNHRHATGSIAQRSKLSSSPGAQHRGSLLMDAESEHLQETECIAALAKAPPSFFAKYRISKSEEATPLELLSNPLLPSEAALAHHQNNMLFISPPDIPSPPKECPPDPPSDVSVEISHSSHSTIPSIRFEDEKKSYRSPESGNASPDLILDLPKNIIPAKNRPRISDSNKDGNSTRAFGLPHPNPTLNQMRKRPSLTPFALYHLIMCMRETGRRLAMSDLAIARACTLMYRALSVLITGRDNTNPSSTGGPVLSTNLQLAPGVVDEFAIDSKDPEIRRMTNKESINESLEKSLNNVDAHTLGMACLSLAGKTQEEHMRMRDVILAYHRCLHQHDMSGQAPLDASEDYDKLRESLVQCELLLMRLLSFDARQPAMPHPYLLHYISALLHWIGKGVVHTNPDQTTSPEQRTRYQSLTRLPGLAWSILADSYHTSLCLQFQPDHIAASILHLALRLAGVEVPGNRQSEMAWWQAISNSLSREIVEEIQLKVMTVYDIDDAMQSRAIPSGRRFE